MKKTTFSVSSLLYRLISGLDIIREITGAVYKDKRPLDSDKEDMVINTQNSIESYGIESKATILIYTSPILADTGNALELRADYKRLEYLCAGVFDGIDQVLYEGVLVWVDTQSFLVQGDMYCTKLEISVSLRE